MSYVRIGFHKEEEGFFPPLTLTAVLCKGSSPSVMKGIDGNFDFFKVIVSGF